MFGGARNGKSANGLRLQKFQLTPDSTSEFVVVAVPFAFALLAILELVDLGIW